MGLNFKGRKEKQGALSKDDMGENVGDTVAKLSKHGGQYEQDTSGAPLCHMRTQPESTLLFDAWSVFSTNTAPAGL